MLMKTTLSKLISSPANFVNSFGLASIRVTKSLGLDDFGVLHVRLAKKTTTVSLRVSNMHRSSAVSLHPPKVLITSLRVERNGTIPRHALPNAVSVAANNMQNRKRNFIGLSSNLSWGAV